jgi:hypothetical protein
MDNGDLLLLAVADVTEPVGIKAIVASTRADIVV